MARCWKPGPAPRASGRRTALARRLARAAMASKTSTARSAATRPTPQPPTPMQGFIARDAAGKPNWPAIKVYAQDFVEELREINVTAHVAQNTSGWRSSIDGGLRVITAMPSACVFASGSRRLSAEPRRWLACARRAIAGCPRWTGSSPSQWQLTTWFACRSCWWWQHDAGTLS